MTLMYCSKEPSRQSLESDLHHYQETTVIEFSLLTFHIESVLWMVGPPYPLGRRKERVLENSIRVESQAVFCSLTHLLQSLCPGPALHH